MRIRIKKHSPNGINRIESWSKIDKASIENNNISIYFRGEDSSGILNLTQAEANSIQVAKSKLPSPAQKKATISKIKNKKKPITKRKKKKK